MQAIAIDTLLVTIIVFLFGAVAWVRPDERRHHWFAGWLCLMGSFVAQLRVPPAGSLHDLPACVSVDLQALTAIFFIASSIAATGKSTRRLWTFVAIPTLVCLTLATLEVSPLWILPAAVLLRQAAALRMAWLQRRYNPSMSLAVLTVCAVTSTWMLYGLLHHRPQVVVEVLLSEVYFVTALDFWNHGWRKSLGLRASAVSLFAWSATYLLRPVVESAWSQFTVAELWHTPKTCVALSMLLMVVEEEIRTARALAQEYQLVFDSNPLPLWIFDTQTFQLLAVNQAACAIHGYTQQEFLSLTLLDVLHPDIREKAKREVHAAHAVPNRASRHIRKDGTEFPMDITAHSIVFKGRKCRLVLAVDVTQRQTLERKLLHQAGHDSLTGFPNRRLFEQLFQKAVAETVNSRTKLAILCFDLCRFKHLNDVYGPRIGDQCVQYVATVLGARTRGREFVARTGDDEFAVVLAGIRDAAEVEETNAFLNESFKAPASIQGYDIQLSFNLGLAICPDNGTDAMSLWHGAESALRLAQSSGTSQIVWLSPEVRADAERKIEIAASLRRNMDQAGFRVAYQPLYGFDGNIRALEALLRFDHPVYGSISPSTVVKVAEDTGLIGSLGQWVIERVCSQIRSWADQNVRLVPVAINVSSLQLMHRDFAEHLVETLFERSIDPKWIHLEVTETAAMSNLKDVSGQMSILSALGCSFAIDDFGTGHSSLGRLHQLPISILKIDRSFIEHLCDRPENGTSFTIVQAILSMAHALRMKVVAEGVESDNQLVCLRHLGCDLLQGFLLSRPVPPDQVPALVAATHPAFASAGDKECHVPSLYVVEDKRAS